jgi:16S rRNA (cytosine967-C5)-methyltransferase
LPKSASESSTDEHSHDKNGKQEQKSTLPNKNQHEEHSSSRQHAQRQRSDKRQHKQHRHSAKQNRQQQSTEHTSVGQQSALGNQELRHEHRHELREHLNSKSNNTSNSESQRESESETRGEHQSKRQSTHSVSETPSQRAFRSLAGNDKATGNNKPQEHTEQLSAERQKNKPDSRHDGKYRPAHHKSSGQHDKHPSPMSEPESFSSDNPLDPLGNLAEHPSEHSVAFTVADIAPDNAEKTDTATTSGSQPSQHSARSAPHHGHNQGDGRADNHTNGRGDNRTTNRTESRNEDGLGGKSGRSTSSSASAAQASGYIVKRAMFTDYAYGVQGYEEEDEAPTDATEKEELVFPPAQPLGAPPMNLDAASLYGTGARGAAIRILSRVERSDTYLDKALEQELAESELSALDKALLTEIVHGVLRWQSKLDWVLTGFYHGEFVKCITPVKNAMRIALYQVMFLTKIPPFAAVNESVELIKRLKGARSANLVNAVLRNIMHNINNIRYPLRESDPTRYLSIMYAHPSWLVRRWLERFGEQDTETLLKTNNERPKISLRLNLLQGQRDELIAFLDSQEVKHWDSPHDDRLLLVGSLSAVRDWQPYRSGWFSVQDPSAAAVVRLAHPMRGQVVVDFCSAPGGKATFAAELMEDSGTIYAIDKYPEKLAAVRENAARLQLSSIHTFAADARTLQPRELRQMIEADTQAARQVSMRSPVEGTSLQELSLSDSQAYNEARSSAETIIERIETTRTDAKSLDKRFDGRRFDQRKQRGKTERRQADSAFDVPPVEYFSNEPLADIVLVDAPCSGTGTLCKKPDIRWKLRADDIAPLVKLQRDILRNAASFVKPGGVLVYSTCTMEPEENIANVEWFLSHFPDFHLDPAEQYVPAELCRDGYIQTFPHIHRTDGAFGARFVRSAAPGTPAAPEQSME